MTALTVKFAKSGSFTKELKRMVGEYLDRPGVRTRAYRQIQTKAVIIGMWTLCSYLALLLFASNWWQVTMFGLSLALSLNAVGFNIMHDGMHGGFSSHPRLNRAAGYTLDLLGGSSYVWDVKHNIAHHTYTNIETHDEDIQLAPLGRMSSTQPWHKHHKLQKYYLFFFYGFMSIRWQIVNDVRTLKRGKVGESRIAMPKGWDLFGLILGKVVFITWIAVLPLATHWSWHGALIVLTTFIGLSWVFSFVLALTFQMAHCVDEAHFASPSDVDPTTGKMKMEWFEYQVRTTADFCPTSRVLTWFMGGLNYQLEHHLFSNETHLHYPAISEMTKKMCTKYNLPYLCQPTLGKAVRAHFRHLDNMGRPPQVVIA
jgi:linoleoyl-CoA desaturase